jgi:hypothetical protein
MGGEVKRESQQFGNILVTWDWDGESQRGVNIAIESAGVMTNDEARQVGVFLIGLTTDVLDA